MKGTDSKKFGKVVRQKLTKHRNAWKSFIETCFNQSIHGKEIEYGHGGSPFESYLLKEDNYHEHI